MPPHHPTPKSLLRRIERLACQEGYSINQFPASAAAEKRAALLAVNYLRTEAAAARREDLERNLAPFLTAAAIVLLLLAICSHTTI